jgi:hypothetical protein
MTKSRDGAYSRDGRGFADRSMLRTRRCRPGQDGRLHRARNSRPALATRGSLLLAALFELRITQAEDDAKGAQIEALVVKLGGDPDTALFGAYRDSLEEVPVSEYPAEDTDRG